MKYVIMKVAPGWFNTCFIPDKIIYCKVKLQQLNCWFPAEGNHLLSGNSGWFLTRKKSYYRIAIFPIPENESFSADSR